MRKRKQRWCQEAGEREKEREGERETEKERFKILHMPKCKPHKLC